MTIKDAKVIKQTVQDVIRTTNANQKFVSSSIAEVLLIQLLLLILLQILHLDQPSAHLSEMHLQLINKLIINPMMVYNKSLVTPITGPLKIQNVKLSLAKSNLLDAYLYILAQQNSLLLKIT